MNTRYAIVSADGIQAACDLITGKPFTRVGRFSTNGFAVLSLHDGMEVANYPELSANRVNNPYSEITLNHESIGRDIVDLVMSEPEWAVPEMGI